MRSALVVMLVSAVLGCGAAGTGNGSLTVEIREPKSCSAEGPPVVLPEPASEGEGGGGGGGARKVDAPPASAFEMHATGDGAIAMSTENLPMYCEPSPTATARIDGTQIKVLIEQRGPLAKCMCDRNLELKIGSALEPGKYTVAVGYKASEGEESFLTKSEVVVGR